MSYAFRITRDLPELGLRRGDVVIYEPSNVVEPYTVHRAITLDPGALLNQYVEGTAEPLDVTPPAFVRARTSASGPRVLLLHAAG